MALRLIWLVLLVLVGSLTFMVLDRIWREDSGPDAKQVSQNSQRTSTQGGPTKPIPNPGQKPKQEPDKQSGHNTSGNEGPSAGRTEIISPGIRNVTPEGMHRGSDLRGQEVVRLPAKEVPPAPARPPRPVQWKLPRVIDAGTLVSPGPLKDVARETTIILADIEALSPEAMCKDVAGEEWACGRFARAALQRYVRNRTIACNPTGETDAPTRITTRCQLSGRDLSVWLVEQGWATADGADDILTRAETNAKEAGLGQWRKEVPRL